MRKKLSNRNVLFESATFHLGAKIKAPAKKVIFKEKSKGTSFFVIEKGRIELQFEGKTRKIIEAGDFFGEIGSLMGSPRTATAVCLTPCELVEFTRELFINLIHESPEIEKKIRDKLVARLLHVRARKDPRIVTLSDKSLEKIISQFERMVIPKDKFLFFEGDPSENIYFIIDGTLGILNGEKIVGQRRRCDFVGEISVLQGVPYMASVLAQEKTEVMRCSSAQFKKILAQFPDWESHILRFAH